MELLDHIRLMARYNQWMNSGVYEAAATLTAEQLKEDRGAFFGSLLGTLNHIMVGDIIWLKRFAQHPADLSALSEIRQLPSPAALNTILHDDFKQLEQIRRSLDEIILNWVMQLTSEHLSDELRYTNTRGEVSSRNLGLLVSHFFNHQTHHRGQATTLLSQLGLDPGVTDLLMLIPEQH